MQVRWHSLQGFCRTRLRFTDYAGPQPAKTPYSTLRSIRFAGCLPRQLLQRGCYVQRVSWMRSNAQLQRQC